MSAARVVRSYTVLVGMEVHVQLATASKMFTGAANGFGGDPNAQVDPVVLGLPGVLPVMNRTAVEYAIKVGLALNCRIAKHTKWDRKSYYYPDLPKNYQISQYDLPLCAEGSFELTLKGGQVRPVRIRRAHLEEDAGKLLHDAPGGYHIDWSIVDLNRAGTPLLEIVTEPDLNSGEEVAAFGQELQKLVQFLGVSHGQMQMGHMRFEPNINVHITDDQGVVHKTAITEIKNLNSFSVLQRATDHEVQRQIAQWVDTGELGRKSTFGWDEAAGATVFQRFKEGEADYRYFPDPDLVPVEVDDAWLTQLKSQVGELPAARRKRYAAAIGLSTADAATLAGDRLTGDFYEAAVAAGGDAKRVGNLVINVLGTLANKAARPVPQLGIRPERVGEVAKLIDGGKLAASNALPLFERLAGGDEPAEAAAGSLGLLQVSDTAAIDAAIDAVLATNPKPLQEYRAGKTAAIGALVGAVKKVDKGFDAKLVQERLKAKLGRLNGAGTNPMRELFAEVVRRGGAGERVAVCTVVATKGSTPQKRGATLLVLADGRTVGTLGGGCVEAEVRRRATALLASAATDTAAYRFSLDQDYGWDDGLICGGVMDVAVQPVGPADVGPYADLADRLAHDRPAERVIAYMLDGRPATFRHDLGPPPVLLIVGAGHVGQALARLAVDVGFRVDVVDDRADHLSADRFPAVRRRIVGDIDAELARYPLDADTFATVITRGHRHDASALHAVVRRPHRYVGLIGSKRKVKAIFDELHAAGVSAETLARVRAPIGLDVGAETVAEIALSIAAELVAVRRGRDGAAVPMKLPADEVARWLGRTQGSTTT